METMEKLVAPASANQDRVINYLFAVLTGGTGGYAYQQAKSMPSLMAGLGFGFLYGCSGYLIANRQYLEGYQLSFLTSILLAGLMLPKAYRTKAPVPVTMASVGVFGAVDMAWRWYSNRGLAAL